MLSNKWTFSLTCLVILLAIGLVFAPSVMADGDNNKTHHDLGITIGAAESLMDVSAKDGLQVDSGRSRTSRLLDLDGDGVKKSGDTGVTLNLILPTDTDTVNDSETGDILTLSVKFTHRVNLETPGASLEDLEQAKKRDEDDPAKATAADSGGNFGVDDIFVAAFDMKGRQLGVLPLINTAVITADFIDAASPGQHFLVTIHQASLLNAYDDNFEISKLVFFIPKGTGSVAKDTDATVTRGIRKADLSHAIAHFTPDAHQHLNKASNRFEIELVDKDEGDPQYAKIEGISAAADASAMTPGVVSVMRTASRAGFVETGDFEVRIILTEEPAGGLTADKIKVENGTVKSVVKGVTYKGGHPAIAATATQPAEQLRAKRDSELGPEMIDYYVPVNDIAQAIAPPDDFTTAPADTAGIGKLATGSTDDNGTVAHFPQATGRDNMYHSYIATISPNANFPGNVIVSVESFDDNVLPVPNRYIPVTPEQRDATRLTGWAEHVRDARVMNETLSVRVSTAVDSKIAAATTAYEGRKKDATTPGVFDSNPNLKALDKGLVIPANGYLVLARGKKDETGILDVTNKENSKLTATQKAYNIKYEFVLPQPAEWLNLFFRNGGALQLVYADIPEATGSGHDNAKASKAKADGTPDKTHKDYTGYDGASSGAIAAGDVIINEIMWTSNYAQYIELHNTTDKPIGIDNLEWAIMVGSGTPPTPFTVIDMVNNAPASGYWSAPSQESEPVIEDGVLTRRTPSGSMSRIPGSTDGSLAASWAASVLRMTKADGTIVATKNFTGTYIGTPGAENAYDTSAQVAAADKAAADAKAAADKAATAKAPVATASDLRITEIMVASGEGRLPQWIEITNTSVGAVSLNGWVVGIDNDSTDADVVASSLSIKLDDVTLDAGQSALVVSKTGRNSGVSARAPKDNNAGDLDSARIVDAHSQIKPASKVYSMLSEMSFRISLEPPLPLAGGVSDRGDVVGNLGGGWELEMSEGSRSSLIRREMGKTAEISGTDAAGWVLASETSLIGAYVGTYYGDKDDVGTPGYNAGGALPVELSKFGAKRDPLTGQVVITWETQSELNNAGFFIKRAEHKTAKFVPVNPTLIPGAGTTSEKQTYTYTDTTAKPNIVYYYQIEDVSLDGNRQTLTRAHRLKGHVGAAGKLTTMWGELKERE